MTERSLSFEQTTLFPEPTEVPLKDKAPRRKRKPCYRLTFQDAVIVWKMRWAGELVSRIATAFDCNQGRISEVLTGKLHPGSEAAARASML